MAIGVDRLLVTGDDPHVRGDIDSIRGDGADDTCDMVARGFL